MHDILCAPDKSVTKAQGFDSALAALWRTILRDLKVRPELFNRLLDSFIRNQSGKLMSDYDRTSLKGNWMKEFAKPKMTWRSLMKGILLLRWGKVKITIEGESYDRPGVKSVHSITMDLSACYDPNNVFEKIYEDDRIETTSERLDEIEKRFFQTVANHNNSNQQKGVVDETPSGKENNNAE